MSSHRATFYVEIEAERYSYTGAVARIKAGKLYQRRPKDARGVVVKLVVEVPDAAFEPLAPEAVIVVPESMVQHPMNIEVRDAQT